MIATSFVFEHSWRFALSDYPANFLAFYVDSKGGCSILVDFSFGGPGIPCQISFLFGAAQIYA